MNSSRQHSDTSDAMVVYGETAIVIAEGPTAMMQGYADRMNAQAPQYNHRVVPKEAK